MPNPENLIMTPERRKEISAKGGRQKGINNRARKAMKEELSMILSLPVKKKSIHNKATKLLEVDRAKALEDFKGMNTTVQTQILLKLTQMAMNGNLKAMQLIHEVTGEATQKTVDTSALERLDDILIGLKEEAFKDEENT